MYGKRGPCPDCDAHPFMGNGRCSRCQGSGVNLRLTSDEPKCPACNGTGICATCQGEGVITTGPGEVQSILHLFD